MHERMIRERFERYGPSPIATGPVLSVAINALSSRSVPGTVRCCGRSRRMYGLLGSLDVLKNTSLDGRSPTAQLRVRVQLIGHL